MYHWWCYHILTSSVIYTWRDAWQHGMYLFYAGALANHYRKSFFVLKSFNITWNPVFAHFGKQKKAFEVIYCLYKMKGNHASVTLKLSGRFSRNEIENLSESRIELRNLQIVKKMLESQVSFCHQSMSLLSQKAYSPPSWSCLPIHCQFDICQFDRLKLSANSNKNSVVEFKA